MFSRPNITRRQAFAAVLAYLALGSPRARVATARERLLPIAVQNFSGASPSEIEKGCDLAQTIASDLGGSGKFAPLDAVLFPHNIIKISDVPLFADWRAIGADYLVNGQLAPFSDGRVHLQSRLWDLSAGQYIAGMQYVTTSERSYLISHVIADAVYERLTGQIARFEEQNKQ
jgi:TolB protein